MDEEMFNPVDETKEESREEISLYGRYRKGYSLDHYSIENYIKNPEDHAIQKHERNPDRKDMDGEGEDFEHRLDDGIENAHDDTANDEESGAARILNLR